MLYNRVKRVDISREQLPGDVYSAFLRHTISVEFEQHWIQSSQKTEPGFDQLVDWCNSGCDNIFSAAKWAQNAAHFRFYLESDLDRFEQHLAKSVAKSADTAS